MALDRQLFAEVYRVRRARRLSQQDLARTVGCSQTAISRFENGDTSAISQETAELISRELNIDPEVLQQFVQKSAYRLMCCPHAECDSHLPTIARGKIHFIPVILKVHKRGMVRCSVCGSVLIDECQDAGCREPIAEKSACCDKCGRPYVELTEPLRSMKDPVPYLNLRLAQFDRFVAFRTGQNQIGTQVQTERSVPTEPVLQ